MTNTSGLVRWLSGAVRFRVKRAERQMELVETLALGGRKQLMLVRCDGQSFLVGCGADGVQSIVPVDEGSR